MPVLHRKISLRELNGVCLPFLLHIHIPILFFFLKFLHIYVILLPNIFKLILYHKITSIQAIQNNIAMIILLPLCLLRAEILFCRYYSLLFFIVLTRIYKGARCDLSNIFQHGVAYSN